MIDLAKIGYPFRTKPLLFAGKAMEYYGLRTSGDIDFIVSREDFRGLAAAYPEQVKEDQGNVGVALSVGEDLFEFWLSSARLGYDDLAEGARELETYYVISLERLLFLRALTSDLVEKNARDVHLLARRIRHDIQAGIFPTRSPLLPLEQERGDASVHRA